MRRVGARRLSAQWCLPFFEASTLKHLAAFRSFFFNMSSCGAVANAKAGADAVLMLRAAIRCLQHMLYKMSSKQLSLGAHRFGDELTGVHGKGVWHATEHSNLDVLRSTSSGAMCSRHVSRLMCGVLSIGDIVFGHMQLTSGGGRMSCMHCMEREFQCGFVSAPRARFLGAQAISLCRAHRLFGSSSWSTHVPCDTTSIRRQGECCTALDDHPRPGSCVHSVWSPRTRQLSKMTAGSRVHVLW